MTLLLDGKHAPLNDPGVDKTPAHYPDFKVNLVSLSMLVNLFLALPLVGSGLWYPSPSVDGKYVRSITETSV